MLSFWKILTFDRPYFLQKYSTSSIILCKEMPKVDLKRERQTQDRGRDIHL